ncbi:MAG: hypothetical protein P8Y69_00235 [Gammaproteobacteria bacterium]|jgi:hypothetical protein
MARDNTITLYNLQLESGCTIAKGWGASSVHLQPLEKTFPEDPNSPDELKAEIPPVWPKTRHVPYHYRHPVNGRPIPY